METSPSHAAACTVAPATLFQRVLKFAVVLSAIGALGLAMYGETAAQPWPDAGNGAGTSPWLPRGVADIAHPSMPAPKRTVPTGPGWVHIGSPYFFYTPIVTRILRFDYNPLRGLDALGFYSPGVGNPYWRLANARSGKNVEPQYPPITFPLLSPWEESSAILADGHSDRKSVV